MFITLPYKYEKGYFCTVYDTYTKIYSINSVRCNEDGREGGDHMGKLKLFENILKAASTLVAALMSFIKFISMAFSMKTEKA